MAFGSGTVQAFGAGVADLYAAEADRFKGKGARIEAEQYAKAATFADQNAQFTKISTDIKEFQTQRSILSSLGKTAADVASSGFAKSGSALDIERDSAMQGELAKSVLGAQGQIEEAGYEQQAASYRLMSQAASLAATAADKAAQGATWAAGFQFAASAVSLIPTPTPKPT